MTATDERRRAILRASANRRTVLKSAAGVAGVAAASRFGIGGRTALAQASEPTGTVTYLSASNFIGNWNPYANLVLPHMRAQRMVYDYLMWFDEKGGFVPGLAES